MQGEDNKKSGGKGAGSGRCAWGDHDAGSKSQRGGNLGNGGKGEEWLIFKNKGYNYR